MSSSEKFCLRWNDFESNISVAFRELREEKDFFDVTLACDDSQIQAHKVILSACSPFFRNVLRRNPHQHPLLYLKGVKYSELMSVLNFMYMGEVNVAQEELNSFLSVAEDLRVKGLTQNNSDSSTKVLAKQEATKQIIRARDPPERDPVPPPKRPRPLATTPQINTPTIQRQSYPPVEDDDIQEVVPVKSEPRDPQPLTPAVVERQQVVYQEEPQGMVEEHDQGTVALDDTYGDESYDYGQYGEGYDDGTGLMDPNTGMAMGGDGNKGQAEIFQQLDEIINTKCYREAGVNICTDCGFQTKHMTNMKNHIETKHMSNQLVRIPCLYCKTVCPTRSAMRMHMKRQHSYTNQ